MTAMLSLPRDNPPFQRSPSSASLAYDTYTPIRKNQYSLPDLRSPSLSGSSRTSSMHSTPSSSVSLDPKSDESSSEDDGLAFPNYTSARQYRKGKGVAKGKGISHGVTPIDMASLKPASSAMRPGSLPSPSPTEGFSSDTPMTTPDPMPMSEDDTAVRKEPSHHVDYLSYEWREEDIWSSWRHIVEHRSVYGERSRLENASWRTWAKAQFKLKTISPETLNW
jgi:hypothetical protein